MLLTPSLLSTDLEERPSKRRRPNGVQGADGICCSGTANTGYGQGCFSDRSPKTHISEGFAEAHITRDCLGPCQEFSSSPGSYSTTNGHGPERVSLLGGAVGQTYSNGITQEDANTAEQVCFGMLTHLSVTLIERSAFEDGVQISVIFEHNSGALFSKADNSRVGILEEHGLHILRSLTEEQSIELQLRCTVELNQQTPGSRVKSNLSRPSAYLSTIIYGPLDLFADVGIFVEKYDMYLQDPHGCDRNVKYRNPHRLSGLDPDVPMTLEFVQLTVSHEKAQIPVDLMASLESDQFLPDTEAPSALRTALYKHQKQALSFMLRRERGWALNSPQKDLWSVETSPSGSRIYINNITQDTQGDAPSEFRGGILADYMGLGKTLSMISLIASDFPEQSQYSQGVYWPGMHQDLHIPPSSIPARPSEQRNETHSSLQLIKTTLLIVPSSLLPSWEGQLIKHLHPGTFRWAKHHGSHKIHDLAQLHQFNIVISTFQTVSSEYRRQATAPSMLFSISWHRVVLDEAHCIRNRNTSTTKAVCAIQAVSRWAMTGTPLQNRLTDFSNLLQFLQVFPYSDHKVFESHIVDVWKAEGDEAAIGRLKKLVKYLALRHSQAAIELPERTDTVQYLDFNPMELAEYRQLELPIVEMLDDALINDGRRSRMYMHALAKINSLRKFCNLGLFTPTLDIRSRLHDPKALAWTSATAQEAFENLVSLGQASCVQCCINLDITFQEGLGDTSQAQMTRCLRLTSYTCFQQTMEYPSLPTCTCEDQGSCSVVTISRNGITSSPATPIARYAMDDNGFPTKIQALCGELQRAGSEKCVVFSSWTTTLDLVQSALSNASILSVRVDGRVSTKDRDIAFDDFRTNPTIRVVLLSISCGAEGLDLTATSRVFLMEPQWNPTIEEQALARVHRLGQTRKVTTVRFIMKDSIEDHVVNVQNRKKHLADLLLSSQKPAQSDLSRSRLQHLQSLLG
ncbi:MAG: hypothetical protein M1839_004768 [Geoglossum umbratile]|nr:MAG: hypothetical protein M1839_004768 [Geoglossum umbratile]